MLNSKTARRYVVTPGHTSPESTVREIGRLIQRGKADPMVRAWAFRVLSAEGVDGRDDEQVTAALLHFVQKVMPYRRDVRGVETLSDVRTLLRSIETGAPGGDCDDFDVILGSLLESVGVAVRIVTTSMDGVNWHHTYLEAFLRDPVRWVALDAAKDTAAVSWEHDGAVRRRVFDLAGRIVKDEATAIPDGLSDCGTCGSHPRGLFS